MPNTIEIPQLDVARLAVHVVGRTPLIMNRFSEEVQAAIEGAQQKTAGSGKKPPRNPQREFELAQYRNAEGDLYVPALWFRRSIGIAAQRFAGEKSVAKAEGSFTIPASELPIHASDPHMRCDRVVLSGPSHLTSLAYRPQIDEWDVWMPLEVVTSFISIERVIEWLMLAGTAVGVGAWRPEKHGDYGQFAVPSDGVISDTAPRAARVA